jgi:hypothetical protein
MGGGVLLLVNKKLEYEVVPTCIRIRKEYYNHIKTIPDKTLSGFVNDAISRELDVLGKSDDWLRKDMEAHLKAANNCKALLQDRNRDRDKQKRVSKKLLDSYKKFCDYLGNYTGGYNTKRVNSEFGINLSDFDEFKELQLKHENGGFSIEDYKELINR